MNEYDQQYYFIRCADNDSLPFLTPDVNTEDRKFRYEKQAIGSAPLVFFNGSKEYQQKKRIPSMKNLPEILFSGADMVVTSRIREALLELDLSYLHMHPVIYIHDDETWYEDYWYLTFAETFDCWDRDSSNYDRDDPPIKLGGFELEQVYSYSLNKELLDETPLEQRLLFKMGRDVDGYITCHRNLFRLFSCGGDSGAKLTLVSEY